MILLWARLAFLLLYAAAGATPEQVAQLDRDMLAVIAGTRPPIGR